jgi:hypothetical protein
LLLTRIISSKICGEQNKSQSGLIGQNEEIGCNRKNEEIESAVKPKLHQDIIVVKKKKWKKKK